MGNKVISCSLDTKSIAKAIKEIQAYKQEIVTKTNVFRNELAALMMDYAQGGFDAAFADDIVNGDVKRANVEVAMSYNGNVTSVIAFGEDAIWVEFGAGVYHNGTAGSSPHPKGQELNLTIGDYGLGHGKQNTWGYYDGTDLILTRGTPSSKPLYNAFKFACEQIYVIARRVFG